MHKRIAIAAAAALIGCGGASWVDPTNGNFSAQDSADVMTMISDAFSAALQIQKAQQNNPMKALTESISVTQQCAVSGTVSVSGTMDSNCSGSNACSFNGSLSLTLASCATANGLVGDGGLNIYANGSSTSSTFALHEAIQGGITVTKNGAVIGTCGINVTADVSSDGVNDTVHVSGSVCRQAVAQ
jgi:hypothetical protein